MPANSAERLALMLAAEDYENSLGHSTVSIKQSRAIAEAFEEHGFDVLIAQNPTNAAARAKLREFSTKVEGAEIAIVILVGHSAGSGGRSFFLPTNARIRRATDLLSRGIAVSSVAQIAARAKAGAVLFLMTVADLPASIASGASRPSMPSKPAENVVVAFSSSGKVPVSRVSAVTRQAALDLIETAHKKPLTLRALVDAAAARGRGLVVGVAPDLDLSSPPNQEIEVSEAELSKENAELQARLEAEKEARRKAEREIVSKEQLEQRRKADREARRQAEIAARQQAESRAKKAEWRARQAEEREHQALERMRRAEERTRQTALPYLRGTTRSNASQTKVIKKTVLVPKDNAVWTAGAIDLAKKLQTELKNRGCYLGRIDGKWGPVSRGALRRFNSEIDGNMRSFEPTTEALKQAQKAQGRICPIVCGAGRTRKGNHCVRTVIRKTTPKSKKRTNTSKKRPPKRREETTGLARQCERFGNFC